jgi:DNA-binding winged helix-turn-helix (wHTH) protein
VASPERPHRVVRFGTFELDSRSLELGQRGRSRARRVRLQQQPARVLSVLLEHPGELVTRDELCKQLWSADTFVDFDNSLNNAISKLRSALGDAAGKPRFVETVGRLGYRFIARVEAIDVPAHTPAPPPELVSRPEAVAEGAPSAGPAPTLVASTPTAMGRPTMVVVAMGLIAGVGVMLAVAAGGRGRAEPSVARAEVALVEAASLAENGRLEEAYARVQRARTELPASVQVSLAATYVLTYAGYLDDAALSLEEAITQGPQYLAETVFVPNVLLYQHRVDRFLSILFATDTPAVRFYRRLAQVEMGSGRQADPALAELWQRNPHVLFAQLARALEAAIAGRADEAHTALVAVTRLREAAGDRDGEMTFKQAQILARAGDVPSALASLDRAVGQGFVCVRCIEDSVLIAPLRPTSDYPRILERARLRHAAFGRRFGFPQEPAAQ